MTQCRHDGRRALLLESVSLILDCLAAAQPEPELIDMLVMIWPVHGSPTVYGFPTTDRLMARAHHCAAIT